MGQPTSRENSVYVTELTLTILKWKHVIASTPKFQLINGRDSSDPGPFSEIFWLPVNSRGVKSFKGFLAFAYPKLVNRPLLDCTGRFVKYIFIWPSNYLSILVEDYNRDPNTKKVRILDFNWSNFLIEIISYCCERVIAHDVIVRYYESELQAQLIPTHTPKPKPFN